MFEHMAATGLGCFGAATGKLQDKVLRSKWVKCEF